MTTVFIISAPSGSGKSTLVSRLLANVPGLMFSVSYTTRKPRGSEVDGESYHFVSREDFEAMIAETNFWNGPRFSAIITAPTGASWKTPAPRAEIWYSTSTCKVRDN